MQSGFVLLSVLEEYNLAWLFEAGRERPVAAGEVIVTEGVRGEFVYLILDGLFAVLSASAGGREVSRLGPGETFGEMSFLDGRPTSATITALEDSTVLAITRADLEAELPQDAGLAAHIYKALAIIVTGRLRKLAGSMAVRTAAGEQPSASPEVVKRWEQIADRTQQFKEAIGAAEQAPDAAALTASLKDFSKYMTDCLGKTSPESFAVRDELGARIQRDLLPSFLKARCIERLAKKPRGYACDYEALHLILENAPGGDDRSGPLLDAAFLELPALRAVRHRHHSVTAQIISYARECPHAMQVAGIGGGAAEPFFEASRALPPGKALRGTIVDFDPHGLKAVAARGTAAGLDDDQFQLLKTSIVHLASSHQKFDMPEQDIIYSLTVADFLDDTLLLRLLNDIYVKLRPGGDLLLSSFHPDNPDRAFLDYAVGWKVFHRSERELSAVFNRSRFHKCKLQFVYEPEGIIFLAVCRKK
ncbi:MAG: cyclic nucleotide-binding domain-containing protein [Chthoniobacter sp.]|uniref:Crp/Fnr family transcriptional regulator n=1 Tax=Chthoniobacter sp. TaxID=2510640 RepID=UPI0032A4C7DE